MAATATPAATESAQLHVGEYATATVEWKGKDGALKTQGDTTWTSIDPSTVHLEPVADDPMTMRLYGSGKLGTTQVYASTKADLGEGKGVKTVTATLDIEVVAGEVEGGEITFTPPGETPPETEATKRKAAAQKAAKEAAAKDAAAKNDKAETGSKAPAHQGSK